MTRSAILFLVLLRLAIGWHFLVEGAQKIPAKYYVQAGLKPVGKPFSSAGYFREAPGPLGRGVPYLTVNADDEALARLVPLPVPAGEDPATYRPQERVPPALHRDWEEYLTRFSDYYGLDEGQRQRAEAVLEQAESDVVAWLSYVPPADAAARAKDPHFEKYTSEQTRRYPSGEVKRQMSMAERVAEYRRKVEEVRDTTQTRLWVFGKDVEGARLRTDRAEVAALRKGLLDDLQEKTKAYHQALEKVLTNTQKAQGEIKVSEETGLVGLVDTITPWALTAIGVCLLVGLFSRLAAFLAAGFLLMTYLAVPAFPWLPAPPASEGNYLFINKNLIEMLALFVLASIPTGRWFGLDATLNAFGRLVFGGRKTEPAEASVPAA